MSEGREHQPAHRRTYRIAGLPNRAPASAMNAVGHVDDLVAAYALGALEADESAAVDAHIRGCATCERALGDAERAASMLPFIVPLHTPPLDTKVALFARVSHAQKAAAASSVPTSNHDAFRTPTLPGSSNVDDLVLPSHVDTAAALPVARSNSRTGWLISAISVPFLIALVATGFWGLQLRNQVATQSSLLAEMQSELTNFGSGTTSYQLSPGGAAPQAEGQIVMGADQRAGMVQIDVNSDDGPGAYEVWVNQDGQLHPVSEVTVNQDGQGQARLELDQPFSEYESVHIKAKPVGTTVEANPMDTLLRDNGGSLGSTGSGLDVGP